MYKFKVGDKVIRVGASMVFKEGKVYTVSDVNDAGFIEISGYTSWGYWSPNKFSLAPDLSKRRPYYDLIIAWANGAEVQWYSESKGEWLNTCSPAWSRETEYRIKPDPKDEALEAAKKAFEQAEEAYKKVAEALAKEGG